MITYIIEKQDDDGQRSYWSCSVRVSNPTGTWGEKKDALMFARNLDGQAFIKSYLGHEAPFCKVVPNAVD